MKFLLIISLLGFSFSSFSSEELTQKVMELRSQIQLESDQLEALKSSVNASIQSLTIEKGELESRKKMLEVQNKEMKRTLVEKKKILGGAELKGYEGYIQSLNQGVDDLITYYNVAIPFKLIPRTEKIKKLKVKFINKEITLAEYVEKYWANLQDEIRLSESVELQNDKIKIEGQTLKVQILKMGMFQAYFKTLNNKYGYASKVNDQWKYNFTDKSEYIEGIEMLIASKEKQVKGGIYKLPVFFNNQGVL